MPFLRRAFVCTLLLTLPACKRGFYNLESHTSEFVYTTLSFSPVTANAAGFHRFAGDFLDEMLDDFSEAALSKQRMFYSTSTMASGRFHATASRRRIKPTTT